MSDPFDPYYKWLGIPPDEQPPNHYRLLGIPPLTDDPDVIDNAADQRMGYIRSFQAGKHGPQSQQLLNEISKAKVCLLNAEQKAEYDREFQAQKDPSAAEVIPQAMRLDEPQSPPVEPTPVQPTPIEATDAVPSPRIDTSRKRRKKAASPALAVVKMVLGGAAGLAVGYLVISYLSPRNDFLGLFAQPTHSDNGKQIAESESPQEAHPATLAPEPRPPATDPTPSPNPEAEIEPPPENEVPENGTAENGNSDPNRAEVPSTEPTDSPAPTSPTETSPTEDPPPSEPSTPPDPPATQVEQLKVQHQQALEQFEVRKATDLAAEIAEQQQGDPLQSQAKTLGQLAAAATDAARQKQVVQALLAVLEEAVAGDRRELAREHQDLLLKTARAAGDQRLINEVTLLVVKIKPM